MRRLRLSKWSRPLLHARSGGAVSRAPPPTPFLDNIPRRCQASAASVSAPGSPDAPDDTESVTKPPPSLPSPPPERALRSAKLAALHARLALPKKIPLQTLARALVTLSADPNPNFNNASLAFLGSTIVNYHVLEYLACKWPRLPMSVLYEVLRAYSGKESLHQVARRWGVEAAAAPGEEVDPGLLQWSAGDQKLASTRWGYVRAEQERRNVYRRGISSRVVLDDDFGDSVSDAPATPETYHSRQDDAFASLVQAVVGSVYTYCGREAAKSFVTSHILSRQVNVASLFVFKRPTRELSMLCAREGFEAPVARLESETGRLSRTPVFVVGIYSGREKLGEAAGPSLGTARRKACMAALKAWYLYSPGNKVRVPSDMMDQDAKPWTPPHIDPGEIV